MTAAPVERPAQSFKAELVGLIPHLRAFARSLCANTAAAEDLAQEALLKAWNNRERFEAGTNLKAWTFTILRNLYYSEHRRAWRNQPLDPDWASNRLVTADTNADAIELLALRNALEMLPKDQRDAIILVGAGGLSYEEVAQVCGTATGTIKSRVSRARATLMRILAENETSYSADPAVPARAAFDDILRQVGEAASSGPA
jgi:RNA polymerase sigma-70 factor, ECF subfamily